MLLQESNLCLPTVQAGRPSLLDEAINHLYTSAKESLGQSLSQRHCRGVFKFLDNSIGTFTPAVRLNLPDATPSCPVADAVFSLHRMSTSCIVNYYYGPPLTEQSLKHFPSAFLTSAQARWEHRPMICWNSLSRETLNSAYTVI